MTQFSSDNMLRFWLGLWKAYGDEDWVSSEYKSAILTQQKTEKKLTKMLLVTCLLTFYLHN